MQHSFGMAAYGLVGWWAGSGMHATASSGSVRVRHSEMLAVWLDRQTEYLDCYHSR